MCVCLFHRERERVAGQRAARSLQSAPPLHTKEQQQQDTERLCKEQKIQTKIHMHDLKVGTFTVCVCADWCCKSTSSLTCTCFAFFSVCRDISLDGIQWCWTEGYVWGRPWLSVTGGGGWERGERGGLWCGQNEDSERWRGQSKSYELKTGENHTEITWKSPVNPSPFKSCSLSQMTRYKLQVWSIIEIKWLNEMKL